MTKKLGGAAAKLVVSPHPGSTCSGRSARRGGRAWRLHVRGDQLPRRPCQLMRPCAACRGTSPSPRGRRRSVACGTLQRTGNCGGWVGGGRAGCREGLSMQGVRPACAAATADACGSWAAGRSAGARRSGAPVLDGQGVGDHRRGRGEQRGRGSARAAPHVDANGKAGCLESAVELQRGVDGGEGWLQLAVRQAAAPAAARTVAHGAHSVWPGWCRLRFAARLGGCGVGGAGGPLVNRCKRPAGRRHRVAAAAAQGPAACGRV